MSDVKTYCKRLKSGSIDDLSEEMSDVMTYSVTD